MIDSDMVFKFRSIALFLTSVTNIRVLHGLLHRLFLSYGRLSVCVG